MKKIFLIVVLSFFSLANLNAQWEIINDGSDLKGFLNTIYFVNENVGWIAMLTNGMLQTTDGGQSWNLLYVDENFVVSQIDFINELTGWAIGFNTCIWKTLDGGQSWTLQFSLADVDFWFSSVFAIDSIKALVVGGNRIYKTTNGGTNWVNVAPNLPGRNYNSILFQDSLTGVVVGNYDVGTIQKGTILKTTNGGTIWTETIVSEFNSIYDLQFLDASNGYFRANKDTAHFICKTVNMFTSWNVITQVISPDIWKNPIPAYQFIDNNLAYAITLDTSWVYSITETMDGGSSWQNLQTVKYVNLNKIYISKKNYSFILGSVTVWGGRGGSASFPVLLKRINSDEWIIQKFTVPLKDVCFWDKNKGIYIGDYPGFHCNGSTIFSTANGGIITDVSFATAGFMNSCFILDENVVYILANRGTSIYKTIDFGLNWVTVFLNNPDSLGFEFLSNDISFLDKQTGFTVGRYADSTGSGAGILKTADSGEIWDLGWQFPDSNNYEYNLKSIYFVEAIGWSVGDGGMIVKYSPQTGWVQQTSVTDLPLNKVFNSDDNFGWIAGGYHNEWDNSFQSIFLKTTNGGTNWTTVPDIPYLFRDIAFVDNNLGWAIGYDSSGVGGILKSTDGGNTWVIDTGTLSAKLNALHIKDDYGWAVGENGLILRTTNAGPTWVENDNQTLPTEFTLEQNYPNPFNPTTKIKYRIPLSPPLLKGEIPIHRDGGFVTLKVYDMLGREAATLVNEEKPAGVYEVEFNGKNLSSGVYFYQLLVSALQSKDGKAGSFIQTKKMVILK